jgi:archaellum component FlaC
MKHAMALALSFALTISVVGAQAQTTTSAKRKRAAAPQTDPAVTQQLADLKQALDAQQQQIKQLSDQLQGRDQKISDLEQKLDQSQSAASQASAKADAVASQSSQEAQDVSGLKTDVADLKTNNTNSALTLQETQKDNQKTIEAINALSKIKFSGDLRLRYEPFIGGGAINAAQPETRNRERYRLRFNMNTKIDNDFAAGLTLASGDLGDPISTNSTLTGFYTRKPIAIDKAFATYNPHYFKPFTLTAGKFGYTWLRTELTWDNDLNPEGGSAAVAWDWKNNFLNHFAVVSFGTTMLEVSGGSDSYMYGGQVQTGWKLLPRVKLSADAAYYDFENADTIAQNQVNGSGANGSATQGLPTPPNFGGSFGFGGSGNTNNFGVINGKRFYASQFGILDAIARLDIDTGAKRWPVYALFDFAQNTKACDNLGVFFAAGIAAPACDPHQRHGYWSELKFGQTKNKGDLMLGYTFARIERDAVVAAFNFSDLRQPTNVAEHRIEAYYQAYPHVQIGFTGLIGRQLVSAQSLTEERWLKRFQFDTIFGF